MQWPYPHLPGVLFCTVPYGAYFLDNKGNAWLKKSGLRRKNALLLKVFGTQVPPPSEGFFSASARVLPLKEESDAN